MSKALIDGTSYDIKGGKALIDGTSYSIKKGRTLIDGIGYDIMFGTPVSGLSVGEKVYLYYNGSYTPFTVVQQGLPNNCNSTTREMLDPYNYDSSCNGTWLVSDYVWSTGYTAQTWYNAMKTGSNLVSFWNNLTTLFNSTAQASMKTVKLPLGWNNLLTTKVFFLSSPEFQYSAYEEGDGFDYYPPAGEGSLLNYYDALGTDLLVKTDTSGTTRLQALRAEPDDASIWLGSHGSFTDEEWEDPDNWETVTALMGVGFSGKLTNIYNQGNSPIYHHLAVILDSTTLISDQHYL